MPASLNYYINPKPYILNLNYYLIPTPSVHAPQRAESDAPPLSLEEEVSQVTTPTWATTAGVRGAERALSPKAATKRCARDLAAQGM